MRSMPCCHPQLLAHLPLVSKACCFYNSRVGSLHVYICVLCYAMLTLKKSKKVSQRNAASSWDRSFVRTMGLQSYKKNYFHADCGVLCTTGTFLQFVDFNPQQTASIWNVIQYGRDCKEHLLHGLQELSGQLMNPRALSQK